MKKDESGPWALFGIRVKTIVIFIIFITLLLVAINRSEIKTLLQMTGIGESPTPSATIDSAIDSESENHIVVDQEMLQEAMKNVQVEKLSELESGDQTIPTDRFFYIVELQSGGDLEGIDLTIEADHVTLISDGGTETKIKRTAVKEIKRFKLPPSKEK